MKPKYDPTLLANARKLSKGTSIPCGIKTIYKLDTGDYGVIDTSIVNDNGGNILLALIY